MLSNNVLQKTLSGFNRITGEYVAAYSPEGIKLFDVPSRDTNFSSQVGDYAHSAADTQTAMGYKFFKVFSDEKLAYIILLEDKDTTEVLGKICAQHITELLDVYRDRLDKDNFIKNLLLDNMLLVDIYSKAKKLHIEMMEKRVVMLIRLPDHQEGNEVGRIRDILKPDSNDVITAINENSIVIISSVENVKDESDIEKKAIVIRESFPSAVKDMVRISYGSIVGELRELSRSYKEAIMAMEIGEIFFKDRSIVAYSLLGIGRIIYQLPLPLCRMFIKEIFKEKRPDDFDEEMLATINKFFENSLNVSETSRQLYIHRNTLVYRLDKLQKATGLDLRVFEDAITFKIAMMVTEYMKYMEADK